jgi:hypothetical protein
MSTTHPQALAAVTAANHWTAWGAFAARRYAEKRGAHPALVRLARQLRAASELIEG